MSARDAQAGIGAGAERGAAGELPPERAADWPPEWACDAAERMLIACGGGAVAVHGVRGGELARALRARGAIVPDGAEGAAPETVVLLADGTERADEAAARLRDSGAASVVVMCEAPDREMWERAMLGAGLRRHARYQRVTPYAALEGERGRVLVLGERVAQREGVRGLEWLSAQRDLHMDMLREAGRRADAHVARYMTAASLVRPGDRVLDCACGMGYGAHVLMRNSRAASVIGVDADAQAVGYASACYGSERVTFRAADAAELSFLPDGSVDLIASFETLEHVADPARMLAEFKRVLTPGGRVVVSVPNRWVDQTGRDPNPHHLRVYDWSGLREQLSAHFEFERAWGQCAGGGMKNGAAPRRLVDAAVDEHGDLRAALDPEWWIGAWVKDPLAGAGTAYRETAYGAGAVSAGNVAAFARDYDNPWLVRSMVSIGMRLSTPTSLRRLAQRVAATARRGSADMGAALCVLAYDMLATSGGVTTESIGDLEERLARFDREADGSPAGLRWRVSNRFARGLLREAAGDGEGAAALFESCAELDVLAFSPLLATKTVDGLFRAGRYRLLTGDVAGGRRLWERALGEAQRALHAEWRDVIGSMDEPLTFGLPELAQVADFASRAAYGLAALSAWGERPGASWELACGSTLSDARSWAQRLERSVSWMTEHAARQEAELSGLRRHATGLEIYAAKLAEDAKWLREHFRATSRDGETTTPADAERRTWIEELERARDWSTSEFARYKAHAEEVRSALEQRVRELERWATELESGRDWNARQRAMLDERIRELTGWNEELRQAAEWHRSQAGAWEERAGAQEARVRELEGWSNELLRGNEWLKQTVCSLQSELAKARSQGAAVEGEGARLGQAAPDGEREYGGGGGGTASVHGAP